MKRVLTATACSCVFLLVAPVQAASLSSGDDVVFGADSITIDSATGLEWLDWTLSKDRSFADVSTQFGSGGDFEGWRHATVDEVQQLYANAGITHVDDGASDYLPVFYLAGLLDFTLPDIGSESYTYGLTGTRRGTIVPPKYSVAYISVDQTDEIGIAFSDYTGYSESDHGIWYGHALVRSPVPEPSSLALLLVGGLGLFGYRARWRNRTPAPPAV